MNQLRHGRVFSVMVVLAILCPSASGIGVGGPWTVVPMKGQTQFVFASAAAPEYYSDFVAHLNMMQQRQMGNGIDPFLGPASYTTQQYQYIAQLGWQIVSWHNTSGSPAAGVYMPNNPPMTAQQKSVLAITDKPGVPTPVHFGEWDNAFHNLIRVGINGYWPVPTTKQQAYNQLKAYFTERNNTYDGRLFSVTGYSCYEPYAAEWGTQCIGMELGENIRNSQTKIAFARGASRQWNLPWSMQFSPWFNECLTTTGPIVFEQGFARGEDAGHSRSLFERMWKHCWFAGAGMVTTEGGDHYLYEEGGVAPFTLTKLGQEANDFYKLTLAHDRGVPYMPLAIVLDRYAGYSTMGGNAGGADESGPWAILSKTSGDQQIDDLFKRQLWPGSIPSDVNSEASFLVATPYGELSDILLSTAQSSLLSRYPEILLAGDITFDSGFVNQLKGALQSGSRLLLKQEHVNAMGSANFSLLQSAGSVEVLSNWINPATGRAAAIPNTRLTQISSEHMPIAVSGSPIQYQINKNNLGWVIELINDKGVNKLPWAAAVIDNSQTALVTLQPRFSSGGYYAIDWESGVATALTGGTATFSVGPGAVRYLQIAQNQWKLTGGGDWSTSANWLVTAPNGIGAGANFLGAITSPATISFSGSTTVGQITFVNSNAYTITASGSSVLTIQASSGGTASISLLSGSHSILAPLSLLSSTSIVGPGRLTTSNIANAAILSVQTTLNTAHLNGPGSTNVAANSTLDADSIEQSALQLGSRALVTIRPSGTPAATSRLQTLSLAASARLDLNDNDLILDYTDASPLASARQLLAAAYNAGHWNGSGLTSSAAASTPRMALGYGEASVLGLFSFSGQSVDATCVLVKYTYGGDANLDGEVDITDLGRLATAWQSAAPWTGGDFSYNSFVDISDLGILATNWQAGVTSPLRSSFDQAIASLGLTGPSSVPEPALASWGIGAGIAAALRRRRHDGMSCRLRPNSDRTTQVAGGLRRRASDLVLIRDAELVRSMQAGRQGTP